MIKIFSSKKKISKFLENHIMKMEQEILKKSYKVFKMKILK